MRLKLAIIITYLFLASMANAQLFKKQLLKENKFDDFTKQYVLESWAYDFGIDPSGSILNPNAAQVSMRAKGILESMEYFIEIIVEIPGNKTKENSYKINKGDKLLIILEDDRVVELESITNNLSNSYSNLHTIEKFTAFVKGSYKLPNEYVEDFKNLKIQKYRIEVYGGNEWNDKIEIDMEMPVSEKGLFKFNHPVTLNKIFADFETALDEYRN